jgi:hypothetical protein
MLCCRGLLVITIIREYGQWQGAERLHYITNDETPPSIDFLFLDDALLLQVMVALLSVFRFDMGGKILFQ